MKKLFNLLIILIILYFGIEISFINLNKGHNLVYKIKKEDKVFNIKEIYTQKKKNEINNYYFEITVDDITFNYQTYNNYKKANYIIKDVDYYDGEYKCINIKDKEGKSISDVICIKDNIEYFYQVIKNKEKNLDKFIKNLKGYNKYTDNKKYKINADPVILYTDNLIDNHFLALQNYKGIYLINEKDKVKNITLFKNDVYTNSSSIVSNNYYVSADYDKEYKFHEFNLVNIKNGKKKKIISNDAISLDSYIQGTINKDIYLFDKSNKLQYRINLKNNTVKVSGRVSEGIQIYENNKFKIGSAYDASSNKILFNKYSVKTKFNNKEYSKVDKVGNKLSGYYYLYLKEDNEYKVYRVNIQNKDILTYLFTTNDINNIYYYEDYIYYKEDNYLKYFQNNLGYKTLLRDKEFEFNKSLKFGLYGE